MQEAFQIRSSEVILFFPFLRLNSDNIHRWHFLAASKVPKKLQITVQFNPVPSVKLKNNRRITA